MKPGKKKKAAKKKADDQTATSGTIFYDSGRATADAAGSDDAGSNAAEMMRILLADHSSHAQRMGEQILSEQVSPKKYRGAMKDFALLRLEDVNPDLVLADVVMPHRSGYDICQYVKISPRHRHTRVLLTAGVRDQVDEAEMRRVHADGVVQKPFEASVLLAMVQPLVELAVKERGPEQPAVRVGQTGRAAATGSRPDRPGACSRRRHGSHGRGHARTD